MKPKKKANQKNVRINDCCYTLKQLDDLLTVQGVWMCEFDGKSYYAIPIEYVKSLDVVLDEFGYYVNVATLKSGETIFIEL